jgi:cytochrome P450
MPPPDFNKRIAEFNHHAPDHHVDVADLWTAMRELPGLGYSGQFGGFDTTAIALTSAMHWLATHPENADTLRTKPETLERAIEEFVRFSSPGSYLRRTVTQDVELGGCPLHAGDRVMMAFAAANRDPAKFACPDQVKLDRFPNAHVGFGAGVHRCIGSFVAKLEMKIALEELLDRYPFFRVDPQGEVRWECGENLGISSLPLILSEEAH